MYKNKSIILHLFKRKICGNLFGCIKKRRHGTYFVESSSRLRREAWGWSMTALPAAFLSCTASCEDLALVGKSLGQEYWSPKNWNQKPNLLCFDMCAILFGEQTNKQTNSHFLFRYEKHLCFAQVNILGLKNFEILFI